MAKLSNYIYRLRHNNILFRQDKNSENEYFICKPIHNKWNIVGDEEEENDIFPTTDDDLLTEEEAYRFAVSIGLPANEFYK